MRRRFPSTEIEAALLLARGPPLSHVGRSHERRARLLRNPGRAARRRPGRDQGGVPQARDEAAPGPESRLQGLRREVQGDRRSLRRAVRSGEARAIRSLRQGRVPEAAGRASGRARRASRTSPICSTKSSAAASRRCSRAAARRGGRATVPRAAPICATTSRSRSNKRSAASEREIVVPRAQSVRAVRRHRLGRQGAARNLPRPATAPAKCARSQGMFRIVRTCPACHGRGQSIKTPCRACGGRGLDAEGAHARGEDSRRRRRRHAHPARRRRRHAARATARPAISISSSR